MNLNIVGYHEKYAAYFKSLNIAWLEEYFSVEAIDSEVLGNPEKYILSSGGFILFALNGDRVVGCVAMKRIGENGFELTKMAVEKMHRGKGIGNELVRRAIFDAILKKAAFIELFSQTELPDAVHLYEKYGFIHQEMPKTVYKRSNVYMVLQLTKYKK